MERLDTKFDGPLLLRPRVFADERGFFMESYRRSLLTDLGAPEEMLQDNHSRSARGVVRGMHFQVGAGASKLVRCGRGAIWDVIVDIRKGSPAYGQWQGFELTDENHHQLYVPVGFAHGFCVLSEVADVLYKQSSYYSGDVESGFSYQDPDVGIEWPLPVGELLPSDRDREAPLLRAIAGELPFTYGS